MTVGEKKTETSLPVTASHKRAIISFIIIMIAVAGKKCCSEYKQMRFYQKNKTENILNIYSRAIVPLGLQVATESTSDYVVLVVVWNPYLKNGQECFKILDVASEFSRKN